MPVLSTHVYTHAVICPLVAFQAMCSADRLPHFALLERKRTDLRSITMLFTTLACAQRRNARACTSARCSIRP